METYLLYPVIGSFVGLMAGLLGAGGGLIIVPALLFTFRADGFSNVVIMHLAIGTSLATIFFTSMSSTYAHHRHGAVQWSTFCGLTPGILAGALAGAAVADQMSGQALRTIFGVFELVVGAQMWFGWRTIAHGVTPGMARLSVAGSTIGFASAVVGIGGATLTVPYLVWSSMNLRQAVATSAALGLPIALGGAAGFLISGWKQPLLPDLSTGYIYWPALAGITVTSLLFAPLGARLAHRLPTMALRRVFALFVVVLGLRILVTI